MGSVLQRIMNDRWFCVGWVQRAHSLKGEVHIRLFAGRADWLSSTDHLGLRGERAVEGQIWEGDVAVETIQSVRVIPGGLLVQFAGSTDRNRAETFEGKSVFIRESKLLTESNQPFLYRFLKAKVEDEAGVLYGNVCDIGSNGSQDLLVVEKEGRTFELPLVFPLVKEVDWSNHRVVVDLPPGLVELNP
jgi:16S rRNA processing protein RimM